MWEGGSCGKRLIFPAPCAPPPSAAIAGRVALVLLAGIILGVGLFYLGLEYMFPKLD